MKALRAFYYATGSRMNWNAPKTRCGGQGFDPAQWEQNSYVASIIVSSILLLADLSESDTVVSGTLRYGPFHDVFGA